MMTPSEMAMYGICRECKAHCIPMRKDGRFYPHRGVFIAIPKDYPISTCVNCSEEYLDERQADKMADLLGIEYARHKEMIEKIKNRDPRIDRAPGN